MYKSLAAPSTTKISTPFDLSIKQSAQVHGDQQVLHLLLLRGRCLWLGFWLWLLLPWSICIICKCLLKQKKPDNFFLCFQDQEEFMILNIVSFGSSWTNAWHSLFLFCFWQGRGRCRCLSRTLPFLLFIFTILPDGNHSDLIFNMTSAT